MASGTGRLWHLGMAVPDLGDAQRQLTDLWGLRWRPPVVRSLSLTGAAGDRYDVAVNVTFSLGGTPAIELWESVPGTPLQTPASGWLHHLGYWVDDFAAEADRLAALSHPPILTNGALPLLNEGPGGLIVEPCDLRRDQPYLRDLFPRGSAHHGEPVLPDARPVTR